jgi:DNA-binding LacI/PurR family transcriptional regulator
MVAKLQYRRGEPKMKTPGRPSFLAGVVAPIVKTYEDRIASGELRNEQMLESERSIAEGFGVSRVAVRRAIEELESKGLLECRPNHRPVIQSPTTQRTVVADTTTRLIMTSIWAPSGDTAGGTLLNGIRRGVRDPRFRVALASGMDGDWDTITTIEDRFLRSLPGDRSIAGLIIWYLGHDRNIPALQLVRDAGIPMVFVDRLPIGFDGDFVGTDNEGSAHQAVRHLLSLGHREIVCVTNLDLVSSVLDRMDGFRHALADYGLPVRGDSFSTFTAETSQTTEAFAIALVRELMSRTNPPTGLFCINDVTAEHLYSAFLSSGYRIPEDISIVGFDGTQRHMPDGGYLTSAFTNPERIGEQAAMLVIRRINEGFDGVYRYIGVDAPVQVHGSSGSPRQGKPRGASSRMVEP